MRQERKLQPPKQEADSLVERLSPTAALKRIIESRRQERVAEGLANRLIDALRRESPIIKL